MLVPHDLDFNGDSTCRNMVDPTSAQDGATKAYVDSVVHGLNWKDNVRAASTANVTVASPGASIDSVALAVSDRVLLKDQTDPIENGIYVWNGAATPMTRSADADTFPKLEAAVVRVDDEAVASNKGTRWRQTAVNGTVGVDDVTWQSDDTSVPNASETVAGVVEIATQAEVDAGTATGGTGAPLAVTPETLDGWADKPLRYAASIGNGADTSLPVSHNLGTQDVVVEVYRNSGNYDKVLCEIRHTDVNTVTLLFTTAPTTNQYRVVILG